MAESELGERKEGKYQVNFTNCNFYNSPPVVGDGNTVNNYNSCLNYPEESTSSRSGGFRMTAIHGDGGEWRGTKRKQSKLRFRQRKHRPKLCPKRGSSESDEQIVRYNGPEIFSTVSSDSDLVNTSKLYSVLKSLHPLRDSGNWKEFNSLADSILRANKGDLELKLLIQIEKSVVVSYQNDLEKAEAMVLEALQTLKGISQEKAKVEMNHFLVTMAHLHLTGFYRRQNKHGKAKNSITFAEQNSRKGNSRFVKALIYYEMASNLTKYISSIPLDRSAREELVERAKNCMKQCIDLCVELDKDGSVYIKKHHFGLLKLALMDLNCRTRAARAQITSSRCIEEAKNCLRVVEEKYEEEMSEGQRIQFFVAKSDLNYRQNDLEGAITHASKALDLAKAHGFSLEINAIKDRQDDITKLITSRETMTLEMLHADEHMESLSSSTSPSQKNSPYSSGCEME
ncbi:uncharacterized protein LOC144665565 [Oculina patagonica]